MKKIIFTIIFFFLTTSAFAAKIDLNQVLGAVDSASNGKVNNLMDKIEKKVDKFDKRFDEYDKKIQEAEKAADKIVKTINSLNQSEIMRYVEMAKYAAIALITLFLLSTILSIAVLIQTIRIKKLLQR